MLSDLRACERKFLYSRVEGLAPVEPSIHLHAGKCMASALEEYRRDLLSYSTYSPPHEHAILAGVRKLWTEWGDPELFENAPKNLAACTEAFISYWDEFPLDTDSYTIHHPAGGKPSLEFTFTLPLGIAHPDTGEEMLYAGRFDAIVHDPVSPSKVLPLDDKTTGQLGTNWPEQWNLRGQLLGYCHALNSAGYDCTGALIRGIFIGKGVPRIVQKEVNLPHWLQERWWSQTRGEIEDLIDLYRDEGPGAFRFNFADSCNAYGGCDFKPLCRAKMPETLYSAYMRRRWNPLTQEEIVE
jgi:hypothetical protein